MKKDIVLTLGANPLPVLVAAMDHASRRRANGDTAPHEAHLIYTPEVADIADRVASALSGHGSPVGQRVCVPQHVDVPRLMNELAKAPISWADTALHYTGGTKLLSVQVRRFWQSRGGNEGDASYLSAAGSLVWDDGRVDVPSGGSLDLSTLSRLHFGVVPKYGDDFDKPARAEIAAKIFSTVKQKGFDDHRHCFPPLYGDGEKPWNHAELGLPDATVKVRLVQHHAAHNDNFKDGEAFATWSYDELCRRLLSRDGALDDLVRQLALSGDGAKGKRCNTVKWLFGDWLEVWLAIYLRALYNEPGVPFFREVHQDVTARRTNERGALVEEFQADVVAVQSYRVVLFSCTTDAKPTMLKHKVFEALARGARLGGDHAKVALVSMTEDPCSVARQAREVGWSGYDDLRVFGAAHIRGGRAPCSVDEGGNPGPELTLDEGLKTWLR